MEHKVVIRQGNAGIEVKKSRFLAAVACVRSEEEAKQFLEEIRRQERDASHHCFAMRIGSPGKELERFSDDGEPQGTAGKPMLGILQKASLYDVCAVVTRYFGGTLLGTGGLLRAYSDALKEGLEDAQTAVLLPGLEFCLACDYSFANRVKYLAETMSLYTEKEEYAEDCRLYYLAGEDLYDSFTGKITELSAGKVTPQEVQKVLFYKAPDGRPSVYTNC